MKFVKSIEKITEIEFYSFGYGKETIKKEIIPILCVDLKSLATVVTWRDLFVASRDKNFSIPLPGEKFGELTENFRDFKKGDLFLIVEEREEECSVKFLKNNFELEIPTDLLVIRNDRETKNYLQKEYKNGLYIKHNKKNRSNISNCSIRRCDEHSLTGMYVLFKHNCKETLNSTPSTSNLSTPNPSTETPSTLNSNSSTQTPPTQNSNP